MNTGDSQDVAPICEADPVCCENDALVRALYRSAGILADLVIQGGLISIGCIFL